MKKINLHPDALCVESFTTDQHQAGIAHARDEAEAAFGGADGTSIKVACIPCTEARTCWCV